MEESGKDARYALEFPWPRKAASGSYRVDVYACRNRQVIARVDAALEVTEVGFPAYMAKLSGEHPWLYGSAAVLVAMIAGFGTDKLAVRLRRRKRETSAGANSPVPEPKPLGPTSPDIAKSEVVHHS